MNRTKTELLIKKYPKLYRQGIAFECNDGWYDLIDSMSQDLEACIEEYQRLTWEKDSDLPCATQVKEKHGTLSFYMTTITDQMEKIIEKAEEKSSKTCEGCGAKGFLRWCKGWKMTLCDTCFTAPNDGQM